MKILIGLMFCLVMLFGCANPFVEARSIKEKREVIKKILIYSGKIEKVDYISISYNYISLVIYFEDGRAIPLRTDGKFLVPAFKNKIMDLYEIHSRQEIYRSGKLVYSFPYTITYVLEYDS